MELALYCPELGYYDRFPHRIGTDGDYYTSVSVGPLFGWLLAMQFARWQNLQTIIPARSSSAAHTMDGWRAISSAGSSSMTPPSTIASNTAWLNRLSRRREWQAATAGSLCSQNPVGGRLVSALNGLHPRDGVRQRASGRLPGASPGLEPGATELVRVGCRPPRRSAGLDPATAARFDRAVPLPDLPLALREQLPDGFTTEVCPGAVAWWRQAALALGQGRLLTLDYGLRAEEFFDPGRGQGTLRAYRQHRLVTDLLAQPGEQDLTAHVNFTAIEQAGLAAGLGTELWTSQGRFLSGILAQSLNERQPGFEWGRGERSQFQMLTHPEHLGARHQVLVQTR
jgi:hypothetical protein